MRVHPWARTAHPWARTAHESTPLGYGCVHLDLKHADFVGHVNVVPDTEVVPALGHHHITQRHPLHVGAVVEQ